MRLIRHIRNTGIALVVLGATGVVAYQLLLDDVAKEGLSQMGRTLIDSYVQLSTLVNDHIGVIMDEDAVRENRQQVRDAWAQIGF